MEPARGSWEGVAVHEEPGLASWVAPPGRVDSTPANQGSRACLAHLGRDCSPGRVALAEAQRRSRHSGGRGGLEHPGKLRFGAQGRVR